MPSAANLLKLATVLGAPAEELYREMRAAAAKDVEEKGASLKEENDWARRARLREAARAVLATRN